MYPDRRVSFSAILNRGTAALGGGAFVVVWVYAHAHAVLLTIEVLWVGGFFAVFLVKYFVWRWLKKQPKQPPAQQDQVI